MNEKRSIVVLVLLVLFLDHVAGISQVRPTTGIDGFGSKLSEAQRKLEEQFRSVPSATNAREELRRLTSEAHIAGSPEDYATAVYVRDQMRSFGLNSDMREYQVLLPYPRPQHRRIDRTPPRTPAGTRGRGPRRSNLGE